MPIRAVKGTQRYLLCSPVCYFSVNLSLSSSFFLSFRGNIELLKGRKLAKKQYHQPNTSRDFSNPKDLLLFISFPPDLSFHIFSFLCPYCNMLSLRICSCCLWEQKHVVILSFPTHASLKHLLSKVQSVNFKSILNLCLWAKDIFYCVLNGMKSDAYNAHYLLKYCLKCHQN